MDNHRFDEYDTHVKELVQRFEEMLSTQDNHFFDVEEFEIIIDYYMESENIEGMNIALQYANEIYPQATPFMIRKAQYYAIEDQTQKALELLNKVEKIEPHNIDLHFIKGTIYSQLHRSEKAIESFNKALSEGDTDLDDIYCNIATEYENLGKHDKAIEYFKKAIQVNPENENYLLDLTSNMDIEQMHAECIEYLNVYLKEHPYSAIGWFNLGMTYMRLELFEKSLDALEYALCIDDSLSMVYSCMAICYSSLNNYPKAIETLKEALQKTTEKAQFLFLIAQEYEILENYETAVIYYKDVLKEEPYHAKAYLGIGICYEKLEDYSLGNEYLVKALELDPQNPEILLICATIFSDHNDYEKASLLFEECATLDMDNPHFWVAYSDMYADQSLYESAIEILHRGRKAITEDIELTYRLAAYYFLLGKKNLAYTSLHEALAKDKTIGQQVLQFCPEMATDENIIHIIDTYQNSTPIS